ncbi:hypothetical protein PAMA110636_12810 [Paenibacillus macerans]
MRSFKNRADQRRCLMLALSALEQGDMPGSQTAAPGMSAARTDEAAWPLHRDQRLHAVLLAVKTAVEWLKFLSRIDLHVCPPPNQEFTNISSIYFIIPNMCSLIKLKISPEPSHIHHLIFFSPFLEPTLYPPPPAPCTKGIIVQRQAGTPRHES